jgi:hypothetical protein
VSQSHLSRVELGDTATNAELVERWTRECRANVQDHDEAAALVESVAVEFTNWRSTIANGLVAMQREIAAAEAVAATRWAWVPMLIPGLLQTPSYTEHLITGRYPDGDDVADAVAARMQRQAILFDRSKTLRWVVGEAGLRWRVAPPDAMVAQLDRVAMLAAEAHLDVRVLPLACTSSAWHDHGFMIRADRADGEPDLVNVELLTGPVNITEPQQVAQYRAAYERLAELALSGAEAVAFIRQVMAEMRA